MSKVDTVAGGVDTAVVARLEAEREELDFECEMLRHENSRLLALNRTLEARLALAVGERDRLKAYLRLVEQSLPWRIAQRIRGWFGRRW